MRKGAVPRPIPIGEPSVLVAEDLERLKSPRHVPSLPQRLRDSHHRIARLAAAGLRTFEIAQRTGYSRVRVQQLLTAPAMEELVAQYRQKVDESFRESTDEYFELATANMLAAERHIADTIADLDEQGELLPVRTALAISRDAADRFGYGKRTLNTNVNVDFAIQLEKALKRSGKTIDSVASQAPPAQLSMARSSHVQTTPQVADSPQPFRRRA